MVATNADSPVRRRAYLDHASSSPLRPEAFEAMVPVLHDAYADPGRLHQEALTVRVAIEDARADIATFLDARPREVVLCSSGTEAINTAHWWAHGHVVTTAVEHAAVREAMQRTGADITTVGVDGEGRYDAGAVIGSVTDATTLVSVQLANHEVGTMQAAADVCRALRERDVRTHVDACAAVGHVPLSFRDLDADLVSVTAHKFGGPPGAAALLVRRGLRLPVFVVGGAQERARRGGIENTAAIVGFAAACRATDVERDAASQRALIDDLWDRVRAIPGITRYGASGADALPHLLCISVDGIEAEPILLALDQRGVAVHSGSACSSEAWEPSPVLLAMGVDAQHSLRISVGWNSTTDDVVRCAAALQAAVEQLRALR